MASGSTVLPGLCVHQQGVEDNVPSLLFFDKMEEHPLNQIHLWDRSARVSMIEPTPHKSNCRFRT
jgi:hypothetical protein